MLETRVVMLSLLVLAGCASAPMPVPSGNSAIDGALRVDVLKMAVPYAKVGTGCNASVESISTEHLGSSPDVAWNAKGEMTAGEFTERWTFTLCAQPRIVYVKVRGLPDGRTYFTVSSKQ